MDSFDEFEFKPITEGLGFHKKSPLKGDASLEQPELGKQTPEPQVKKEVLSAFRSKDEFLEEKPSGKHPWGEPKVRQPLPRPGDPTTSSSAPLPSAMSGAIASGAAALGAFGTGPATPTMSAKTAPIPGTPTQKPILKSKPELSLKPDLSLKAETRTAQANSAASTFVEPKLVPISLNVPGLIIDTIVILAISILFLVALLIITKVDLIAVMSNAQYDTMTQLSLTLLFVSVVQLYMITMRSFMGLTLGEWVFDSQLGTAAQQNSVLYPLQVMWRSIFLTLTGVVVIPVLSLLVRKDLAAYATGLNLYARQDS